MLFNVGGGSEGWFFRHGDDGCVVIDGGFDVSEAMVVIGFVLEVEVLF